VDPYGPGPLPHRLAKLVATSPSQFVSAVFPGKLKASLQTALLPHLTNYSPLSGPLAIGRHERARCTCHCLTARVLRRYGPNRNGRKLWSSTSLNRTHIINTGQGTVSYANFWPGSSDIVTAAVMGGLFAGIRPHSQFCSRKYLIQSRVSCCFRDTPQLFSVTQMAIFGVQR